MAGAKQEKTRDVKREEAQDAKQGELQSAKQKKIQADSGAPASSLGGDIHVNAWNGKAIPVPVPGADGQHMRLSGPIEHDNIVNGYGLRAVIWTQGCYTHCPGCQNPETWAPEEGVLVDIDTIKEELASLKGQAGLTFCGGEPFIQPEGCLEITRFVKEELGWNVWSFTGFTYDIIKEWGGKQWELLCNLDALIDGPFILAQRDLTLKFRGSRNQRLLHLDKGQIIRVE